MKILQSGVPKCGNFWLYQIIHNVLKKSGMPSQGYIEQHPIFPLAKTWDLNFPDQARIDVLEITDLQLSYRISSIFQMPIVDFEDYLSKTNHIWTHSPICKRSGEVFRQMDKIIYIIRDPRDRAISAAKYYCSDYMLKYFPQEEKDPAVFLSKNFDRLMEEWVWHVWDHLRLAHKYNLHITFYENWLGDFQQELRQLLDYLGLELDVKDMSVLEEELTFATLKKKNPDHLKKGTSGYWKDALSEEQIARAHIIAGPIMDFLKYRSASSPSYTSKDDPGLFEELKQQLIESQKVLY